LLVGHELGQFGERNRRTVDFGHEESLEDNGIEFGFCSAGQESVKLDQKSQVNVLLSSFF
jgi:hypothetical protein